jgi:calnexin
MLYISSVCFAAEDSKVEEETPPSVEPVVPAAETEARQKIVFSPPPTPDAFFHAFFSDESLMDPKWIRSIAKKDGVDISIAKYDGQWAFEVPTTSAIEADYSLVLKSKAKHHAISVLLQKPVDFKHAELVVQYEVKFQQGMECGGAYVKLLSDSPQLDLGQFGDKTPYTIMFGPDKCGNDHKLHFIFRHKNPITGVYEEKHANKAKGDMESYFNDKKSHLYTLVVRADNTFEIYIDQTLFNSGNLLKDFTPAVNPEKEIDDPSDKKPANWDEREKIQDPDATKPDDWDEAAAELIEDANAVKPEGWLDNEPLLIPDPSSKKPQDWDKEMDGEWEPPKIDNSKCKAAPGCGPWLKPKVKNPKYKGKWAASMIVNPNYQGVWKAGRIANPNFFEDSHPYNSLTTVPALGLELWSMSEEIAFDNFIITHSKAVADEYATATWAVKKTEERRADPKAQSVVDAVRDITSEKPWVWLVVALVIGVPVIIIVYLCCRSSSPPSGTSNNNEHSKPQYSGLRPPSADVDVDAGMTASANELRHEEDEEEECASEEEQNAPDLNEKAKLEESDDEPEDQKDAEEPAGDNEETNQQVRQRKPKRKANKD